MKNLISNIQIRNLAGDISGLTPSGYLKTSGGEISGNLLISGNLYASDINLSGVQILGKNVPLVLEGNAGGFSSLSYPFFETQAGNMRISATAGGLIWGSNSWKSLDVGDNYAGFSEMGLFTKGYVLTSGGYIVSGLMSYVDGTETVIDVVDPAKYASANYKIFATTERISGDPSRFIEYDTSFSKNTGIFDSVRYLGGEADQSGQILKISSRLDGGVVEIYAENDCFENWRLNSIVRKTPTEMT